VAFSLLVSDASFACPALQVDRWTAARGVPTYAYQFNDDNAPLNILPPDKQHLGLSTHGTELPYLFDQPNAPFPVTRTLTPDQQALAASMRTDWASFAGTGNPSSRALPWPSFNGTRVLSLVPLQSQVTTDFATSVTGMPAWKTLPSWAVVATADHAIHPHAERDMAKRAGSEITEIDASHAVLATHPADVAAVIVRAVKAVK
jgi:para-nitrobenzyl esterase